MLRPAFLVFCLLAARGLFACTGDCLTCHPALMPTIHKDKRHEPMLYCIKCHSAKPNAMAECGSDCFSCHSVEKIEKVNVPEHKVIRNCRNCHMKMKEAVTDISTPKDQSTVKPLKELLMPGSGAGF